MIYEMRRYECLPGKLASLNSLMENLAIPIMKKHGMTLVGAWTPLVGDVEATLIYILAFETMDEWKTKWASFYADQEWKEKRAEIARKEGGPMVARISNVFIAPTSYSPLQ